MALRRFIVFSMCLAIAPGVLAQDIKPLPKAETRFEEDPPVTMVPDTGLTFKGYDCIIDCTAHMAGYAWAQAKMVHAYEECQDGHSNAFKEGCYAYVKEEYPDAPPP